MSERSVGSAPGAEAASSAKVQACLEAGTWSRWPKLLGAGLFGLMCGVVATTIVRKPLPQTAVATALPEQVAPAEPVEAKQSGSQEQTGFFNFDPASRNLRLEGWSDAELAQGKWFAWCCRKTCTIAVENAETVDRSIAFEAAPFGFPDAPPQSVEVLLNGASLGRYPLPQGLSVTRAPAPHSLWRIGRNIVSFEFAYATAPRDRFAHNPDPRSLTAAFIWLAVTGS